MSFSSFLLVADVSQLSLLPKIISTLESLFGLTIFGIILSKLVSYRIDIMISEMFLTSLSSRLHSHRGLIHNEQLKLYTFTETIKNTNKFEKNELIELHNILNAFWMEFINLRAFIKKSTIRLKPILEEEILISFMNFLPFIEHTLRVLLKDIKTIDSISKDWKKSRNRIALRGIANVNDGIIKWYNKNLEIESGDKKVIKRIDTHINEIKELSRS